MKDFEKRGVVFFLKNGKVGYSSNSDISFQSALTVFLSDFQEEMVYELTQRQTSTLKKTKVSSFSAEMAIAKIDELMANPVIKTHHQFIDALDELPEFNYDPFWLGVMRLYETLYHNTFFYWNGVEILDNSPKDVVAVPLKNWVIGWTN